ncbi:hypothetical protein NAT51_19345 [Flavobacterium amniphilum]|uniref:hypothetical protein n=1 Tax=Flavobacterium amniphilum TaxID=1834035 RepID=UPI00202A6D0E|nr:hypothetical protein [Flavobacterium amniphilum]MCL9807687.1 hypothetical protein [Flavobacterium amniphilum]
MKKIILLILLVLSNLSNAQKAIVPKSGTIVFVSKDSIFDEKNYESSLKEIVAELKKQVKEDFIRESIANGTPEDTLKLNLLTGYNDGMYGLLKEMSKRTSKVTHEHKGDKIIRTYESNGVRQNSLVININENHDPVIPKLKEGQAPNELVEATNDFLNKYTYSNNKIESIKEDKKKIRKISGYDCFKVVYVFSDAKKSDSSFINGFKTTRELWVTDKIKSSFHPIIDDKEIITKYYPLEVLEYSSMQKGTVTVHKIEKMDIN